MKKKRMPQNNYLEYYKLSAPILIFVVGIYIASIDKKIDCMSQQIFHHLTNDEIHTPKSIVNTRAEFEIYQAMHNQQYEDLKGSIKELIILLTETTTQRRK